MRVGLRSALLGTSCRLISEFADNAESSGRTSLFAIIPILEIYAPTVSRGHAITGGHGE